MKEFQDLILGGGKAGKSLALSLAASGRQVALIERLLIGGSCINVACIPTKTLVASAKLAHQASRASDWGLEIGQLSAPLKAVIARKRNLVQSLVDKHWKLFTEQDNLTFFVGEGRFLDSKTIEITNRDGEKLCLSGERIFINTGSRSQIPNIEGLNTIPYLTSTSIMELEQLPAHLAIVGGGYIALEFAQIFRRLGSKITVLLRGSRFLPKEDVDIAEAIRLHLQSEGIVFRQDVKFLKASKTSEQLILSLETKGKVETLSADQILIATGRTLNTDGLNLEAAGVESEVNGAIKVNDRLETTANNIWALGDCNGGPLFTHASFDDFRIVRDNLQHNGNRTRAGRLMPYTLFIDPELGRVGLTEEQSLQAGYKIKVAKLPASAIPRAQTTGEKEGLLKAVIDEDTDQILGASFFCRESGEIMSIIQTAMLAKMPYTAVRDTIFAHPTMAEALNLLLATI